MLLEANSLQPSPCMRASSGLSYVIHEAHALQHACAGLWRGTSVAVSVVSLRLGPRSSQRVLGTERIVAVNLDHPNIVTTYVYDSVEPTDAGAGGPGGRGSTRAYAVQELCNGGSLRSALTRGVLAPAALRPRWPSVLRILCGVAAGMDYMHSLRVFHGALTPSNILFKVCRSLACCMEPGFIQTPSELCI